MSIPTKFEDADAGAGPWPTSMQNVDLDQDVLMQAENVFNAEDAESPDSTRGDAHAPDERGSALLEPGTVVGIGSWAANVSQNTGQEQPAARMLDEDNWTKPRTAPLSNDGSPARDRATGSCEGSTLVSLLRDLNKELGNALSKQQDIKGDAVAERLVIELRSHQLEHAKHIEALFAKQEESIIAKLGFEAVVVPRVERAHHPVDTPPRMSPPLASRISPRPASPRPSPRLAAPRVSFEPFPANDSAGSGRRSLPGFASVASPPVPPNGALPDPQTSPPGESPAFDLPHSVPEQEVSTRTPWEQAEDGETDTFADLQNDVTLEAEHEKEDQERRDRSSDREIRVKKAKSISKNQTVDLSHIKVKRVEEHMQDNTAKGQGNRRHSVMSAYMEEDIHPLRKLAVLVVADRRFEIGTCLVILINVVIIGVEADEEMKDPLGDNAVWHRVVNVLFMVLFTIELLLRITVETWSFFNWYNTKIRWNIFDSFLVATAIFEEVLQLFTSESPDLSVMRIMRTMRIVRGFRIVRVFAFFRDLRVMVAGIAHSFQSLIWALLLLMSMMYLFSVCLLQFAADEHLNQQQNTIERIILSKEDYKDLMDFFGNLARTTYTLYLSIMGGVDWIEPAMPLFKLNPFLGLLFCAYIAFALLCVLNIITGVFVENANRMTEQDEEMVMMEQMEHRKQWFEEVKVLFQAADTDGSGCLDAQEFTRQMEDLRMQAWFRKIGVHVESYSAQGLFQLLDFDGDGKLDLDEFAMALQQVHGTARSIDVARVSREAKCMRREIRELAGVCMSMYDMLQMNRPARSQALRSCRTLSSIQ